LSLRAFGEQEGVGYAKLLYWKRKFEREGGASDRAGLVAIDVVRGSNSGETPVAPGKMEVWLSNGIGVDVAPGFDADELRRLVGVLQSC